MVFHTFSYIWKTKEYNEVGCLLLISPDKMVQGKDEFRGWNSQLPNDLKASVHALKRNFLPQGAGLSLLKIRHRMLSYL